MLVLSSHIYNHSLSGSLLIERHGMYVGSYDFKMWRKTWNFRLNVKQIKHKVEETCWSTSEFILLDDAWWRRFVQNLRKMKKEDCCYSVHSHKPNELHKYRISVHSTSLFISLFLPHLLSFDAENRQAKLGLQKLAANFPLLPSAPPSRTTLLNVGSICTIMRRPSDAPVLSFDIFRFPCTSLQVYMYMYTKYTRFIMICVFLRLWDRK